MDARGSAVLQATACYDNNDHYEEDDYNKEDHDKEDYNDQKEIIMKRSSFFLFSCLYLCIAATPLTAGAQTKDGGISQQMLQQIQQQNAPTASVRALRNALAANAIENLAKNQATAGELDTYFSVETKKQSITDQKSSGRCWMFSGLNVLRSNLPNVQTPSPSSFLRTTSSSGTSWRRPT